MEKIPIDADGKVLVTDLLDYATKRSAQLALLAVADETLNSICLVGQGQGFLMMAREIGMAALAQQSTGETVQ